MSINEKYMASMQTPESIVEEMEKIFSAGKFLKSLNLSLDVLRLELASSSQIVNVGSKREEPQRPTNVVIISTPLSLSFDDTESNRTENWTVKIPAAGNDDAVVSPSDRAFCVTLQSLYELCGEGGVPKHKQKDFLERHINPFLDYYRGNSGVATMPLELAVVWVQFCNSSVGVLKGTLTSLLTATELLQCILPIADGNGDEVCDLGLLQPLCEELLSLVVLRTVPYLLHNSMVNRLLDAIFKIKEHEFVDIDKPSSSNLGNQLYQFSTKANMACIETAIKQLKQQHEGARRSSGQDGFMLRCSSHLITTLQTMLLGENIGTRQTLCSEPDMRTKDKVLNIPSESNDHHQHKQTSNHIRNLVTTYIVDPLWYDEDRWMYRGQALALTLTACLAWKKRRRLWSVSKSTTRSLLAPVEELWNALLAK